MNIEKKYANEIKDSLNPKTTFEDLNLPIPTKKTVKQKTFKKFVPYVCGLVACSIAGAIIIPNVLRIIEGGKAPVIDETDKTKINDPDTGNNEDKEPKEFSIYDSMFDDLIETREDFSHSIPYTTYQISKTNKLKKAPALRLNTIYDEYEYISDFDLLTKEHDFSNKIILKGQVVITEVREEGVNGVFSYSGTEVYNIPNLHEDISENKVLNIVMLGIFHNNFDNPYFECEECLDFYIDEYQGVGHCYDDSDYLMEWLSDMNKNAYLNIAGNVRITEKNGSLISGIFEKSGITFENVECNFDVNVDDYVYVKMLGLIPDKNSLKLEQVIFYYCEEAHIDEYNIQKISDSEFLEEYANLDLNKPFKITGFAKITRYENGLVSGVFYDSGLIFEDSKIIENRYESLDSIYLEMIANFDGDLESKKLTNCNIKYFYKDDFCTDSEDADIQTRNNLNKFKENPDLKDMQFIHLLVSTSSFDKEKNTYSATGYLKDGSKVVIEDKELTFLEEYNKIDFIDSFSKDNINNFSIEFYGLATYENVDGLDTYFINYIAETWISCVPVNITNKMDEIKPTIEKYGNPYPNEILCWNYDNETFANSKDDIAYLIPQQLGDYYEIYTTAYFKVEIDGRDSLLTAMFGKGIAECTYAKTNLEELITIVKDGKMFSCSGFEMHKVIRGYYLYKDLSFSHSINIKIDPSLKKVSDCGFGKIDNDSIVFNEINKMYTWDEFIDLENGFSEPQEEGNDIQ